MKFEEALGLMRNKKHIMKVVDEPDYIYRFDYSRLERLNISTSFQSWDEVRELDTFRLINKEWDYLRYSFFDAVKSCLSDKASFIRDTPKCGNYTRCINYRDGKMITDDLRAEDIAADDWRRQ